MNHQRVKDPLNAALRGTSPQGALMAFCRPRPKRILKWLGIQLFIIGLYVLAYFAMKDTGGPLKDAGHLVPAKRTADSKAKIVVQPKRHKSVLKGNVAPPRVKPTQNKSIKSGRSQVVAPKVVPPVKQILTRPTRIPPEQLPPELAKKPIIDHGKMIVLFTYMRGGSSFLGQMFDKNPSAVYLFEPLDGIYSSLYGVPLLMPSLDITHNYDRMPRRYPITEKEKIAKTVFNLLACNVDQLPTEILIHPFVYRQVKSNSYGLYGKCLSKFNPESFRWKCVPFKPTCDKRPKGKKPLRCEKLGKLFVPVDMKKVSKEYSSCLERLRNISMSCISLMEEECRRTSVRALKSVRLTADIIRTLLTMHPTVKIIYYLRDPRGIVRSRYKEGLLSINSHNDMLKEVSMLCEDMQKDIKTMVELRKVRPKNVLIQYYEKFAMDPEKVATEAYQFAEVYMPPVVLQHLHNLTHANSDTAAYETSRANATATAFAWRHELSKPLIGKMTKACKEYFEEAQKIQPLYIP